MKDCPCRDCDDRTPTCHSVCEEYKKFDQKCKEARARRYSESQSEYYSKSAEKFSQRRKKGRH